MSEFSLTEKMLAIEKQTQANREAALQKALEETQQAYLKLEEEKKNCFHKHGIK